MSIKTTNPEHISTILAVVMANLKSEVKMPTLISVGGNSGEIGRCDAKCYGAQHPECDCVYGGKNHGVGLKQAQNNIKEITQGVLERYAGQDIKFNEQQLEVFNAN